MLGCRLTPELSRTDARPRRRHNHSAGAEAAKRSRLERIVRQLTSLLLARQAASGAEEWTCEPPGPGCALASCSRRLRLQTECSRSRLHGGCGRLGRRSATGQGLPTHDYEIFVWRCLTPELSRADLRRRQSHNLTRLCRRREAVSA